MPKPMGHSIARYTYFECWCVDKPASNW